VKVIIRDRRLGRENALGLAHSDGVIEIDPRLSARRRLTILIHEAMHIAFPDMAETTVERKSALIGKLVWRDGYRRFPQQVAEQGVTDCGTSGPRACK